MPGLQIDVNSAIAVVSAVVSLGSLVVAVLAYRAATQQSRASVYELRKAVYEQVEAFLAAWIRSGRPDLDLLKPLVVSWDRSHFLFSKEVTSFIRQLWIDAIAADYSHGIIAGTVKGDRAKAVEESYALMIKYGDEKFALRDVFHEMRV